MEQCLKLVTGFAQIFVCEIIYLFGSYLRFKNQYKFWYKTPKSSKSP